MQGSGAWAARRSRQALDWMWALVDQGLRSRFEHHAAVRAALPDIRAAVAAGTLPASGAALRLLQAMD
jgi:LAO/AO transport system kinase